jgi:predicted Fe-Mo cluster-binding NifX family protein
MSLIVCVTAKAEGAEATVEPRFGRAPYFVFADTDAGTFVPVKNDLVDAAGGVGPRAAQVLVDHSATVLLTGQIGGNAATALKAAGIKVYSFGDAATVAQALEKYTQGGLSELL